MWFVHLNILVLEAGSEFPVAHSEFLRSAQVLQVRKTNFYRPANALGVAKAAARAGATKHLDPLRQRVYALVGRQGETNYHQRNLANTNSRKITSHIFARKNTTAVHCRALKFNQALCRQTAEVHCGKIKGPPTKRQNILVEY